MVLNDVCETYLKKHVIVHTLRKQKCIYKENKNFFSDTHRHEEKTRTWFAM